MAQFKLKVNLTYKQAYTMVTEGKSNQYGMRRHDEKHIIGLKNTAYLTYLNGDFWRVTNKGDPAGDRKGIVLKGKDKRWYVFTIKDGIPDPEKVYKKYLKEGGAEIKSLEQKYGSIKVPANKPKIRKKSGAGMGAL